MLLVTWISHRVSKFQSNFHLAIFWNWPLLMVHLFTALWFWTQTLWHCHHLAIYSTHPGVLTSLPPMGSNFAFYGTGGTREVRPIFSFFRHPPQNWKYRFLIGWVERLFALKNSLVIIRPWICCEDVTLLLLLAFGGYRFNVLHY